MNPFLQVLAFRIAPLCPRLALCLRRVHPYLANHISIPQAYLRDLNFYQGPLKWPSYDVIQSFNSLDLLSHFDWHATKCWFLLDFLCCIFPFMKDYSANWHAEVDRAYSGMNPCCIFLWVPPQESEKILDDEGICFSSYAARCCADNKCVLECTRADVDAQKETVLKQPHYQWVWFRNRLRDCLQINCERFIEWTS